MIRTAHMRLVPATVAMIRAEIADRAAFAEMLGATVPADWPPESAADAVPWFLEQLEIDPVGRAGWLAWYGIGESGVLVGGAGFKGPPVDGMVETGYSVLPAYQRQGYATEMVGALVEWAMAQPGVNRVIADTDENNVPSLRLLGNLGFNAIGAGAEPGCIRFERASNKASGNK
jgi:[ribosomal protein S5]-alanine N-acetyltransferase